MKNILIISFVLLFGHVNTFGTNYAHKKSEESIKDSSAVDSLYLSIIEKSDSVCWYLVDAMSEDTTSYSLWETLACVTDTSNERKDALIATLTYKDSFCKTSMVKECTFMPDVAVEFYTGHMWVAFAYSFYCDICRFSTADKYQDIDGEKIRNSILQMACEVFPKDKYLRLLKRRKR